MKNRHNGPGHTMTGTRVAMLPAPILATAEMNNILTTGKTLMIIVISSNKTRSGGSYMRGSRKAPLT